MYIYRNMLDRVNGKTALTIRAKGTVREIVRPALVGLWLRSSRRAARSDTAAIRLVGTPGLMLTVIPQYVNGTLCAMIRNGNGKPV